MQIPRGWDRRSVSKLLPTKKSRNMEIVVQVLKHLPPGAPRILAVLGLGLMFFFPEIRRIFTKRHRDKDRLEQATQLLEFRKLELTVMDLKAKHPDAKNEKIDSQIEKILNESDPDVEPNQLNEEEEQIGWVARLKYSLAGSFALMILGAVALLLSGRFQGDQDAVKAILIELGLAVLSAVLASAIPSRSRWECVFRGFLIPTLIGALTVAAMSNQ